MLPEYLERTPSNFIVGGKRWRLVLCPLAGVVGLTDFETQTVSVDPNFPAAELLDTLFHELTHVINYTYDPDQGEQADHDEWSAQLGGRGWSDLWLSNPGLIAWVNRVCKFARKRRE